MYFVICITTTVVRIEMDMLTKVESFHTTREMPPSVCDLKWNGYKRLDSYLGGTAISAMFECLDRCQKMTILPRSLKNSLLVKMNE